MKKIFTILTMTFTMAVAAVAQQVPNANFEDWSGEKFDNKAQPAAWHFSNVTQFGFKFAFSHKETGHNGGSCVMVQDQEVGAAGITEVSPGYIALGNPWVYIASLTQTNAATAGTKGGIAYTYRPDTMQVWIKRTGDNVMREDFHLLYYSWKGTAKANKYKGKNGSCTKVDGPYIDEESDIRQATDGNECGTDQYATQVAEGWWYERKEYADWTCVNVPIFYANDEAPEKMNIIFSASNYPNFRANSGLYAGNSLYVDDVRMIYSAKIQTLYVGGKPWKGFLPDSEEEQTYSLGEHATEMPEIYAMRGQGALTNSKNNTTVTFPGRRLSDSECRIVPGVIDGAPTTITVSAEDGSSTMTYKIKFVRAASTNSRLAGIRVNDKDINTFNAFTTTYNYELPYGTTTAPEVSVVLAEDAQTVSITQPTSVNGTATIVVTAADKKTKTTYTVNFSVEQLKDNTLSDILIDGEPLIDFRPTKNSYIVELPLGTTSVPSIQAVSAYAAGEQTITYTDNGLTGTYKISVSAPGNSVVREYKLSFIIKPSSYVMLKDLAVEGYPITFESGRKVYYVELPSGTQENNLPAISWTAGDKYQTIAQLPLEKDEDNNLISKIQVTAASGDVLVYKVIFIINRSSYAYLDAIQVAGQPLAGFSPTQSQYEMELPIATTTLPAITYTKGDEFQTVTISNSPIDEVDHTASSRLTVTAENGDVFIYVINYTIAQADNTTLKAIYVNGTAIEGFTPDNRSYAVSLPNGTDDWPTITYDLHDEYQSVSERKAAFAEDEANTLTLCVTSGSGTTANYVITFTVAAASKNTALQSLSVNGTAIANFDPAKTDYTYALPIGTTAVPTIAATKAENVQKLTITQAKSVTGTATVKVTAESGATKTYKVTFVVTKSSNNALQAITVGGAALANFTPEQTEYSINLPAGTASLPVVSYTKGDNYQTVKVTNNVFNLAGDYLLTVIAQNGDARTYTLHFSVTVSNNAALQALFVNGEAVADFDAAKTDYTVALPQGTTAMPNITWTKGDEAQQVELVSGGLNGKSEIIVVAQDGKTVRSYYLQFTVAQSANNALTQIYLNGEPIDGFQSDVLSYSCNLTSRTTSLPVVTFDKGDEYQTVVVRDEEMTGLEGAYRLVVKAQNGSTRTYTLNFAVVVSSNSLLNGIALDGVALTDFSKSTTSYAVELPVGTTQLPVITYTQGDEMQEVKVQSEGVNGKTTLVVTAENKTTTTYTITFSVKKSDNTTLTAIQLDGKQLDGFDPETTTYNIDLKSTTTQLPQVTYTAHDSYQTITIREDGMSGLNGDYKIIVLAQNGATRTYTLHFEIKISSNASLASLLVDGVTVKNYDPSTLEYICSLPMGTTEAPEITWTMGDEFQQVTPQLRGLDGRNDIIVVAQDGTRRVYSITFEVVKSDNVQLQMIYLNGEELEGFDMNTLSYHVTLPIGTQTLPEITCLKTLDNQQIAIIYGNLNDESHVAVTSVAGTCATYTIYFEAAHSSECRLQAIKVNGTALPDFTPDQTDYTLTLPVGTAQVPTIEGVPANEWQRVIVNNQGLNATSSLVVFAEDGSSMTYALHITVAQSSETTLAAIKVGDDVLPLVDGQWEYDYTLAAEATACPSITIEKKQPAQQVTMTAPRAEGTAYINVTAEDGTQATYTITIHKDYSGVSDVCTLKSLRIGDEPIALHAGAYVYNKVLPSGTTTLPEIVAVPTHAGASVAITRGTVVDTTYIRVLAEDKIHSQLYKLACSLATSQSTLLSALRIDGQDILVPGQFDYSIEIPYNTPVCPTMDAIKGGENQNVVIVRPAIFGPAYVYVSLEGATEVTTYTVNFVNTVNTNALLADIRLNDNLLADFDPYITDYDIDADALGFTAMPTIQAIPADASQQVAVYPTSIDGVTSIMVTAQDGSYNLYTLHFQHEKEKTAGVSMIYLDGEPMADFDPAQHEYFRELTDGRPTVETIVVETSSDRQSVEIIQPTGVGDAVITTRSEDMSASATYTIHYAYPVHTDATLADIRLNGVTLPDFAAQTLNYHMIITSDVAEGTMDIAYTVRDTTQTVVLVNNGAKGAQLIVRAENGTQQTYTITYEIAKSTFAGLKDILLYITSEDESDYISLPHFKADSTDYTYTLPRHAQVVPAIFPVKSYAEQQVTITYGEMEEPTTLRVLAEDGTTEQIYTVTFTTIKSDNALLERLTLDTEYDVDFTFSPEVNEYDILLPFGTDSVPGYEFVKADADQLVTWTNAPLGDTTTIQVKAENGDINIYKLYFHAEQTTTANRLAAISILETGAELDMSDRTQREFEVNMPYGSRSFTIQYEKMFPEQTVLVYAGGLRAATQLIVKSNRPGEEDVVYTITPHVQTDDPAVLTDIQINNATINGFNPNRFSYIVPVTSSPIVRYTAAQGAMVNVLQQNSKHWQAEVTANGRTNVYDIWYYYSEDVIPNGEFTEWTNCATYTSATKPTSWNTVADVLGKHSGFGNYTPNELVTKKGSDEVHLATKYSIPGGGEIPGFITLGTVTSSTGWKVAGGTSFSINGGITFRNTPDQMKIRYYSESVEKNNLIQYVLNNKTLEWKEGKTSSYAEHTYDLSEANAAVPQPTYMYITLSSYYCTTGTTSSSSPEMYVDWVRFAYNHTLKGLQVNGSNAEMSGTAFSYTLTDPEQIETPQLTFIGEVVDQAQTVTWTSETISGQYGVRNATIRNFAENGTDYTDYTLTVKRPLDTRNSLQDIQLNGVSISGFDANRLSYDVHMNYRTKQLPDFRAVPLSSRQTITTTMNGSVITVVVKPEYGESKTYMINFITDHNSDASLANIYGLDAFSPTTLEYEVESFANYIPAKRLDAQHLTYTETATERRFRVVAEDGTTEQTYLIRLQAAGQTSSGQLSAIYVNKTLTDGFNADTYSYTQAIEQGSGIAFARQYAADAVTEIFYADSVVWNLTGHTYVLHFEQSTLSAQTDLADIWVNGRSLEGFSPLLKEYTYRTTDAGVQVQPVSQSGQTLATTYIGNQITVNVTSEDGLHEATYMLTLRRQESGVTTLALITMNGDTLADFDPSLRKYNVVLPAPSEPKQADAAMPSFGFVAGTAGQQIVVENYGMGSAIYVTVTAENGTTKGTYTINLSTEPSNITDLAGLYVNGQSLLDDKHSEYTVTLSSEDEPDVQYFTYAESPFQKVKFNRHTDFSEPDEITVTAQNKQSRTYFVHYQVSPLYHCADLQGLSIDGEIYDAFRSDIYNYTLDLPAHAQSIPVLNGLQSDDRQTVEVIPGGTQDTTFMVVTAPDGVTTRTYTFRFATVQSSNTELLGLSVDYAPISGFTPDQLTYQTTAENAQYTIQYVRAEATQQVLTFRNGNTTNLLVIAQSGATRLYSLTVNVLTSTTDPYLAGIIIDNTPLANFEPEKQNYEVTLPMGTTALPQITALAGEPGQQITIHRGDINGKTTISVIAADGEQMQNYNLLFNVPDATCDTLAMLYRDGAEWDGFDAHIQEYTDTLSEGTTIFPYVAYRCGDAWQTVRLDTLSNTPYEQALRFRVTAQSGASREYMIRFVVRKSSDTRLKMIYLDGRPLADFASEITDYQVSLPIGTSTYPTVTYTESSPAQQVLVTADATDLHTLVNTLTVTAENGAQRIYRVAMTVLLSSATELRQIVVNDEPLARKGKGYTADADFAGDVHRYHIDWNIGTTMLPQITYTPEDAYQTITLLHAMSHLNDSLLIRVAAQNGDTALYVVTNTLLHSDCDTLKQIYINSLPLATFDAHRDTFYYDLPVGTRTFPEMEAVRGDQYQTLTTHLVSQTQYESVQTITVMAEDGIHSRMYTLIYRVERSSDNMLAQLLVNGQLLPVDQTEHTLTWPVGTKTLPVIECVRGDEYQTIDYLRTLTTLDDTAKIRVTAENGAERIYTLASVLLHSNCDTLKMIYINAEPLADFDARRDTTTIYLPVGTRSFPDFSVVKGDVYQATPILSVVYMNAYEALHRITVTPEQGPTRDYYLRFVIAQSSDASLTNIRINGLPLALSGNGYTCDAAFDAGTLMYHLTWEVGTTLLPEVTCIKGDYQTVTFRNAMRSLNDSLFIDVMAEDGTLLTYTLYNTLAHDDDASLRGIRVKGVEMEDFDPATQDTAYYTLPVGTRTWPPYEPIPANRWQRVAEHLLTASAYERQIAFTVTAEDGEATHTYVLCMTIAQASDATLSDIMVNGEPLEGFAPDTYRYHLDWKVGYADVPQFTFVVADTLAEARTLHTPLSADDSLVVRVEAQNGNTCTYVVTNTLLHSSCDTLAMIYSGGKNVSNFDAKVLDYTLALPVGTRQLPILEWQTGDKYQTVKIDTVYMLDYEASFRIRVQAEDGVHSRVYAINYTVAKSSVDSLRAIFVAGKLLPGFDAQVTDYTYIVDADTVPTITWETGDKYQSVRVEYGTIDAVSTLYVTSEDGTQNSYRILFRQRRSTSTQLDALYYDGAMVPLFDPEMLSYEVVLPYGTKAMPAVSGLAHEPSQTLQTTVYDFQQWLASVTVLAEDGLHEATYTVHFTIARCANATLDAILVDGQMIADFAPTTYDYEVELPAGTTTKPTLTYVCVESDSIHVDIYDNATSWTDTIMVTSDSAYYANLGTSLPREAYSTLYTVHFRVAASSESRLASLMVDGELLEGFAADRSEYVFAYPFGTDSAALISTARLTWVAMDSTTSVTITEEQPGQITVMAMAQDGMTISIYTIRQSIARNNQLEAIFLDGDSLKGFTPDQTHYEYLLLPGTMVLPDVTALAQDTTAEVSVSLGILDSVPCLIYCEAQDGTETVYEVMFRTASMNFRSAEATANEVLVQRIPGTMDIAVSSLRDNVSFALYDASGILLEYVPVTICDPNNCVTETDWQGATHFLRVMDISDCTRVTLDPNKVYFYTFYEFDKRRVHSGKIVVVQ